MESEEGQGSCFHFTILAKCVPPNPEPVPAAATSSAHNPAAPGLRVLLAEDNLVNQKVARRILEKEGYLVSVAGSGKAALDLVLQQTFDLIFMDVQMPEMDGIEATRTIRENEKRTGQHIPIIALTAHAMSGDRERCVAAGMDGYASKPIRLDELRQEIERLRSVLT